MFSPTQTIHTNSDTFSTTPNPHFHGVFSTHSLATAAVKAMKPASILRHTDASKQEYIARTVDDDKIVVAKKELCCLENTVIPAGGTVYLAVDACGSSIVEHGVFTGEQEAWDACFVFQQRRGGSYWIKEKSWTDAKGCRHMEAEYDCQRSHIRGALMTDLLKHWYVEACVLDAHLT